MPYKKIIKATSLFGGVQVINLLLSVIKTKFITIILGPNGYGLLSLLTNAVEVLRSIVGFSIETSGVKNISLYYKNNESEKLNFEYSLLLRIAFFSGVAGVFLAIIFAPLMSYWVFDTTEKWFLFVFLSIIILFKQITNGNSAALQGFEHYTWLAKITIFSSLFSLFFTLGLLYFYKFDGIVPSLITTAFINFLVSKYYISNIKIKPRKIPISEVIIKGKELFLFGGLLTISGYVPMLMNYALQLHIQHTEGLAKVGIFSVALLVMNGYVDLIFNAMSTEYYPRLSAYINDNTKTSEAVNYQLEFAMLLITPILLVFMGFGEFIIQILFSKQFLEVMPLLKWAFIGMFFKAVSFCMAYLVVAKADKKVFLYKTIIFSVLYIIFLYIGYSILNLQGIGIALLFYYFLYLLVAYFLSIYWYKIKINKSIFQLFIKSLFFFIVIFFVLNISIFWLKYLIVLLIILLSSLYSIRKIFNNFVKN